MSPFFVKYFRSNNPCHLCPAESSTERTPGKSLCGSHLKLARIVFRLWSIVRRKHRKCIACDDHTDRNNCRCPSHRQANRKRCIQWFNDNRDRRSKYNLERKEAHIAAGRCPNCPQHRALEPGFRRCSTCRAVHQVQSKGGNWSLVVEAHKERRAFKAARQLEAETNLKAELAQMGYRFSARGGVKSVRRVDAR